MSGHKVKIAARLRPRINGEIDDGSITIQHAASTSSSDPSSSGSSSSSAISVTNPHNPSQVFKFPYVVIGCVNRCSCNSCAARFTSCYGESSTQEEIFENDVQPMIDIVYSGVVSRVICSSLVGSTLIQWSDSNYLRIRRHIIRQDPHNARYQDGPRRYSACRSSMLSPILSRQVQLTCPDHVLETSTAAAIHRNTFRFVYGDIQG